MAGRAKTEADRQEALYSTDRLTPREAWMATRVGNAP